MDENLCRSFLAVSGPPNCARCLFAILCSHGGMGSAFVQGPFLGHPGGLRNVFELAPLVVVLNVATGEPLGDLLAGQVGVPRCDICDDPTVAVIVDLQSGRRPFPESGPPGLPGYIPGRAWAAPVR